MHSTNYFDTFIQVAPDSTAPGAAEPPARATPSVSELTFRMITDAPFEHTSDDVIFGVWADRKGIPVTERAAARDEFFSKGQACMRSSDLAKRYGWGVLSDAEGRISLVPLGSDEYEQLSSGTRADGTPVTVTQAMRSTRR
jgi:hypothetical protein